MTRPQRRAVIDIGTNSVKLLIAEVDGAEVRPLCEDSRQTRLGEGFYETHRLQRAPVARTAAAVREFSQAARAWKAKSLRIIATSAARDARNPQALRRAVKRAANLRVEIISGRQEADWTFSGVTSDSRLAAVPLLLLDVGGGSTEFILGHGARQHFRHSYALGTVRLLEKFPPTDPPAPSELARARKWVQSFLRRELKPKLGPALRREIKLAARPAKVQLVGTGGTASILARMQLKLDGYDRELLENTRLTQRAIRAQTKRLWRLPLARRQRIVGLPANRADVMLMGGVIYEAVLAEFGFTELRVSTRGLRFAAVLDHD